MKNTLTILLVILGFGASGTKADGQDQSNKDLMRKIKIKKALVTLLEEGALVLPENKCPEIEPSLLDELRRNGTVTPSNGPVLTTICVVPEPY